MKPQSSHTTQSTASQPSAKRLRLDDATRCQHQTPSGRRCQMPIRAAGERLCYEHMNQYKKQDAFNLRDALETDYQGFQTAQGINFALRNLYGLLANNYISPRRASVLAYISSLLLRTLPAIDADHAANIIDPTADPEPAPAEIPEAAAVGHTATEAATPTSEVAPAPNSVDSTSPTSSSEPAPAPATEPASATNAAAPSAWPSGIPEPDPTKKPS